MEFEGEFLFDKKWSGKGYDINGNIIYELINGKGEVKEYENSNYSNENIIFEGEYLNGLKHGYGKEYNKKGYLIFEGKFLNGERNGKGKEYNKLEEGLVFEGEYLNGKRWNGKGKEFDKKLGYISFEGEYINGVKKEWWTWCYKYYLFYYEKLNKIKLKGFNMIKLKIWYLII